tara:strand:+ start:4218 stop:4361 length:144 start_codon:yes stop_codon:yes gene_type:complete
MEMFAVYVNGEKKGNYSLEDAAIIGEHHRVNHPENTVEIIELATSSY